MWIAERSAIKPRDEENAAMAYQKSSRCESRTEARDLLALMISKEIKGWERMNMSTDRERDALALLESTDLDKIEVKGVRWAIREF